MANLVITSTTNTIKSDNGIYAGIPGPFGIIQKKITFRKDEIGRIALAPADAYVLINFKNIGIELLLVYTPTSGALAVDTVDGVAPNSNSDLYEKLIALIA